MLRGRALKRALVLAAALLWAWPVAADNTIGGSCTSVGQSGNGAREADGNNEWCNGTTWQYPAYQFGSTTNSCSSTTAGQVQYTGGVLEYCNGSAWTVLQPAPIWTGPLYSGYGTNGSCSSSPCTATITSTQGGDLLLVGAEYNTTSSQSITAVTSSACSGSWVLNPGTTNVFNTQNGTYGITWAYCLSDVAGVTSISVTLPHVAFFEVLEFSSGGAPITLDSAVGALNSGNGSTLAGVALSPTGTDLLVQGEHGCGVTAISEGYSMPGYYTTTTQFGFNLNSADGEAPTWSTTATYDCVITGFAFK